jgi:hypothetical protein
MSSMSHSPTGAVREPRGPAMFLAREAWASLAIAAMWIAVAVSAVWGPDFVSSSGSGTNSTTIPTGIAVAMFAAIGTWAVAKYALGEREKSSEPAGGKEA